MYFILSECFKTITSSLSHQHKYGWRLNLPLQMWWNSWVLDEQSDELATNLTKIMHWLYEAGLFRVSDCTQFHSFNRNLYVLTYINETHRLLTIQIIIWHLEIKKKNVFFYSSCSESRHAAPKCWFRTQLLAQN
jgi:hypothetical protein